jgi:hypothetical protein
MKRLSLQTLVMVFCLTAARPAGAGGMTETLPGGGWLVDVAFYLSQLSQMYDDDSELRPLLPEIDRYEPGGGYQGTIIPDANVRYGILAIQLQYGILDNLSLGIGVPVVLFNTIEPSLSWRRGDYLQQVGRAYSGEDFWGWAESMGQPKPENWRGNGGVLSDMLVGLRYRFSDHFRALAESEWALALSVYGALPTGTPPDPEAVVAAGTTSWDLHSQGELAFHLSLDRFFEKHLGGRFILSLDLFYEFFFRHEYDTPQGEKNPLLLNYRPYVGPTYTIDPGDFWGGSFQVSMVPLYGPTRATWLVNGNRERAKYFPPLLSLSVRYTHVQIQQSDWESESEIWDSQQGSNWGPGYKNILSAELQLSLLRLGAPLILYARYRNLDWIGGRNSRAAQVWTFGTRIPAKIW